MGRKSKKARLIKPFCYFCLREFDNEKILIQHQKAKHFKCSECNRKLETANGLMVHMQQVHKMAQRRVPNSLEGRDNINSSIQGMNGVPPEVVEEHRMQHFQKLNNLNKQKQQRINWTQIQAPGFTNTYNPNLTNVNLQNNGTQTQNTSGFNTASLQTNNFTTSLSNTNNTNTNTGFDSSSNLVSNSILNEDTFTADASEEMMSNTNKLLILDPNGMPIYQQVQPSTQQQPTNTQTNLFLLQQQNKLGFKQNFSNLSQSGFDSGVQNYLTTSTTNNNNNTNSTTTQPPTQFSDSSTYTGVVLPSNQQSSFTSFTSPITGVNGTVSGTANTSGFANTGTLTTTPGFTTGSLQTNNFTTNTNNTTASSFSNELPLFNEHDLSTSTNNVPEDDTFTTIHYKVTGLQPLYIPTPSLGNTKLSYSSDSVSIEELRAKVKYNWHETPS